MNRQVLICLAGVASIVLSACSRTTHTINGQIVIEVPQVQLPGERDVGTACSGANYGSRLGVKLFHT